MSRALKIAALVACLSPLACSGEPVPANKTQYVGLWVASDSHVGIFANGRFEYRKRLRFGLHNSNQGWVEFTDDSLEISTFTSFTINSPPHEKNGRWTMTLDDIEYQRVGPPMSYGRSNNWPEAMH